MILSTRRSSLVRALATVALVAGPVLLVPADADACSYAQMVEPVSPQPGETGVPVDVVIRLEANFPFEQQGSTPVITLHELDGADMPVGDPVPFSLQSLPTLSSMRHPLHLAPAAPLKAQTRYRLTLDNLWTSPSRVTFETGSHNAPAPTPPAVPSVSVHPFDPVPTACIDSCTHYELGGLVVDQGNAPPGHTFNLYDQTGLIAADLRGWDRLDVDCRANGTPWAWSLTPGQHTFELRSVNAAGAESTGVTFTADVQCVANPDAGVSGCSDAGSDAGDRGPTGQNDEGVADGGTADLMPDSSDPIGCSATGPGAVLSPWIIGLGLGLLAQRLRKPARVRMQ